MKELTDFLGTTAGLLNLVGYIFYYLQIKKGESDPSITSCAMWFFLALFQAVSYTEISRDLFSLMAFLVDSVACFYILILLLRRKWKEQQVVGALQITIFVIGVVFFFFICVFGSMKIANIADCVAYIISFYFTIKKVKENPLNENSKSWWLCTLSYLLTGVVVSIKHCTFCIDMLSPALLFILHIIVALLCSKSRKIRYMSAMKSENNLSS